MTTNRKPESLTVTWADADTILVALNLAVTVYTSTRGEGDGMTKALADVLNRLEEDFNRKA